MIAKCYFIHRINYSCFRNKVLILKRRSWTDAVSVYSNLTRLKVSRTAWTGGCYSPFVEGNQCNRTLDNLGNWDKTTSRNAEGKLINYYIFVVSGSATDKHPGTQRDHRLDPLDIKRSFKLRTCPGQSHYLINLCRWHYPLGMAEREADHAACSSHYNQSGEHISYLYRTRTFCDISSSA